MKYIVSKIEIFFRLLQNRYKNQQDKNQEGFCKKNKFEEEKFVTVLIIDSAPEILKNKTQIWKYLLRFQNIAVLNKANVMSHQ